ncbi:hypothetical protein GCM10027432_29110 [Lysobacter fragariae]
MIAMVVLAILLAIALPAWSHARAAVGSGSIKASLATVLIDAVRHSTITGTEVIVCPRDGGDQCSGQPHWDGGWIAYADINGNRSRDANETVLARGKPLEKGFHLHSTVGRTRVIFQPNGGNAGSNITFTLCDPRGPAQATTLVLSNIGNLHNGTPSDTAARECAYGG